MSRIDPAQGLLNVNWSEFSFSAIRLVDRIYAQLNPVISNIDNLN